jgi:hypothetical protein
VSQLSDDSSGSIISLRWRRPDIEGLEELLETLRSIPTSEMLSRELVAECWAIPYYVRGFKQIAGLDAGASDNVARIEKAIVVELHRILGTPREIGQAAQLLD